MGWLKTNVDGAFRVESRAGAWGFVVRRHDGESIPAGAGNESLNALMAETVACVKALEAAEAHGISRVQIETDSSQLCEALKSTTRDLEPSGMMFRYIREFLVDQFVCSSICNVPCVCNAAAHELARLGIMWDPGQSMLWQDDLQENVKKVVTRDYAEFSLINARP